MSTTASIWSRKNPFPAPLLLNRKLTGDGSEKDTRHYEISLAGSGLSYEVGDSLVVFPSNDPGLAEAIIKALHATGEETVPGAEAGTTKTLRDALVNDFGIKEPSKQFLTALAEKAGDSAPLLRDLLTPEKKAELEQYLWGMEYIDFLLDHPSVTFTAEEFVKLLRKLTPRLYSIASSIKANPEQVHLTVATVRYTSHGRERKGVASTFLAERVASNGGTIPVFFHVAKGFRLPEDGATPVIMVGPGTGVAPFRAYVQERKASGATGKNWLFFGEQREKEDFLYREEFEQYVAEGTLKLTTAFSRDQKEKIYVQHRLMENAAEVWKWLEEGAHFFVCGDAARMAKDVDAALHKIVETEGGKTPEQAAEYMEALKKEKRYKRDVY